MKEKFKNGICIFLLLFFIVLLFKENALFKSCILKGCVLFFQQVFPSLFPMFILQDFFLYFQVFRVFDFLYPCFRFIFKSKLAFSCFLISTISGTPANAQLLTHLVQKGYLNAQEASVILSYSCFLNPLFLYSMLSSIGDNQTALFIMILQYGFNLVLAFFRRHFPYSEKDFSIMEEKEAFFPFLQKSITKSFSLLFSILGIIIFYMLICEGIGIFIKNPVFDCFLNGILETTGGLQKITLLQVNSKLRLGLAAFFASFLGFSIHTQIKSIVLDAAISTKPFFIAKVFQSLFLTFVVLIIS